MGIADIRSSEKKRITQMVESTVVDQTTGEIIEQTKAVVYTVENEPAYVKMYLNDLSKLLDLPKAHTDLLYILMTMMDYENIVTLSPRKRDRICQQLNITKQSLANNLHKLAKVDAVRSVGRGEYQLNPELFAKGSWADIKNLQLSYRKRLKMTVEYDGDERTIRCDVVDREPVQLDIEDAIRHAAE